jgi:hypothetical protein
MQVASLSLCKELFELSGWDDAKFGWSYYYDGNQRKGDMVFYRLYQSPSWSSDCPAYDLGFLLRKLPAIIPSEVAYESSCLHLMKSSTRYTFSYTHRKHKLNSKSDTPEDAAAKLCIELFKQSILIKETK